MTNYNALIPPTVWALILLAGLVYTMTVNDYMKKDEVIYLGVGLASYAVYWATMLLLWQVLVRGKLTTKAQIEEGAMQSSCEVSPPASTCNSGQAFSSDDEEEGTTDNDSCSEVFSADEEVGQARISCLGKKLDNENEDTAYKAFLAFLRN
ncbi:hypothetical protein HJC23_006121 [Cyclotella cryptica]|uniref:Uncharacterized protein n=1 Tax=Cyclotella cryptica TaxID=29204 RepID=A0ABD3QKG2_9STRA